MGGHTNVNEERHKCEKCGKIFTMKSSLKRHMRTHDTEKTPKNLEKSIECPQCGKLYVKFII